MTSPAPTVPPIPAPVANRVVHVTMEPLFSGRTDYNDQVGYTVIADGGPLDLLATLPPLDGNTAYLRVVDGDTGRYLVADRCIADFSERSYLLSNPDVAAAVAAGGFASGREHYLAYGWREGRDPSVLFDAGAYLSANPDVAAAGMDPAAHFREFGFAEGRDAWRVHSVEGGVAIYPDPLSGLNLAWIL